MRDLVASCLLALACTTNATADDSTTRTAKVQPVRMGGLVGLWSQSQPLVNAVTTSEPTGPEWKLALRLASALGHRAKACQRIRYPVVEIDGGRLPGAEGVRFDFGGLVVERLRLAGRAEARAFGLYAVGDGTRPTLVEVRGHQVVLIQGEPLEDPRFGLRVRALAWEGLRAPAGAPQALGLFLGANDAILSLKAPEPNVEKRFVEAFTLAARRASGFRLLGRGHLRVEAEGVRAELLRRGMSRRLWTTTEPARGDFLRSYQRLLEGESTRLDRAPAARKARRHQRDGGQSGGRIVVGILPPGSVPGFDGLLGPAGHFGQMNSTAELGGMGIQPAGTRARITVEPAQPRGAAANLSRRFD